MCSVICTQEGGVQVEGLALLMKKSGDSMTSLAEYIGVEVNTVWRWKAGVSTPSIDVQRKICERYECSFDDLLNPPKPSARTGKSRAKRKKAA